MNPDVLPPDFRGLDPSLPIRMYRRHLPHWRQEGAAYFVTFRLADALPQSKLDELGAARIAWMNSHPDPTEKDWMEYVRKVLRKTERWLDEGYGECLLAQRNNQQSVCETIHHFDGTRCRLFSYVVMPNHVHILVSPTASEALEVLVESWKRHAALEINRRAGRKGTVWQEEYFDRIVRDASHLRKVLNYIRENPGNAGVSAPVWITPAWRTWLEC